MKRRIAAGDKHSGPLKPWLIKHLRPAVGHGLLSGHARLGVTAEAVRALVRRHHLPRLRGNDGKTLVAIDLDEVWHKPLPARSPRGHQPVTETLARLRARIAGLEAELAAEQQHSAGHRADYEHERERADRMVATQDRLVAELETLRGLLAAIQEAARPRTSWLGGWRWLLKTSYP